MAFIAHEHCTSTSAIDRYWVFGTKDEALVFFKGMIEAWAGGLDVGFYEELYGELHEKPHETNSEIKKKLTREELVASLTADLAAGDGDFYVQLTDDDYLVLAHVAADGSARRA
jgi:hypothetical protein